MNKQPKIVTLSKEDKAVLRKIAKLRKQVSAAWVDEVALEMGKKTRTIRAYASGNRGITEGSHIEVLRILINILDKKNKRIDNLLS